MKNKILIINSFWPKHLYESYGVDVLKTNKELFFLRNLFLKLFNYKKTSFFYEKDWEKKCLNYDIVILFDSGRDIVYEAKKIENSISPSTRLVFFMLNPISYNHYINGISEQWEKWSFSKKDSLENGYKYGETFYFKELVENYPQKNKVYDSVFVGLDKGRMKDLNNLENIYFSHKVNALFYIVDNLRSIYNKKFKKRLSYSKCLALVQKSKTITDVIQKGQEGMTIRVMESVFFKKKLITNNVELKNRRIFCSENIFLIGEDDYCNLNSFINSPYKELPDNEVEKYEFSQWLKRIVSIQEFK